MGLCLLHPLLLAASALSLEEPLRCALCAERLDLERAGQVDIIIPAVSVPKSIGDRLLRAIRAGQPLQVRVPCCSSLHPPSSREVSSLCRVRLGSLCVRPVHPAEHC